MVRVITQHEHRELLTFDEAFEAVRDGNRDWATYPSSIVNQPRDRIYNPETNVRLTIHSGSSPRRDGIGTILHPEIPRSDETSQEYGNNGEQLYTLYDGTTSDLRGIIIGDIQIEGFPSEGLRGCQTAMDAAVDVDRLARDDASTLGMFGSGKQAAHHLLVIDHLRDLDHVRVYSPTKENREEFEQRMSEFVDAEIQVVGTPEAVIDGADIVMCATNASSPIFDGDLLESGQTVISIVGGDIGLVEIGNSPQRRRELDSKTFERADLVTARSISLAKEDEQGDLYEPVQEGIISWDAIVEMRDIVAGDHPGRESDEQLVVHKQNSRQGITQTALMTELFEKAEAEEIGSVL